MKKERVECARFKYNSHNLDLFLIYVFSALQAYRIRAPSCWLPQTAKLFFSSYEAKFLLDNVRNTGGEESLLREAGVWILAII